MVEATLSGGGGGGGAALVVGLVAGAVVGRIGCEVRRRVGRGRSDPRSSEPPERSTERVLAAGVTDGLWLDSTGGRRGELDSALLVSGRFEGVRSSIGRMRPSCGVRRDAASGSILRAKSEPFAV